MKAGAGRRLPVHGGRPAGRPRFLRGLPLNSRSTRPQSLRMRSNSEATDAGPVISEGLGHAVGGTSAPTPSAGRCSKQSEKVKYSEA